MLNRLSGRQWAAVGAACLAGAAIAVVVALLPAGGGDDEPDRPDEPAGAGPVREAIEGAAATRSADDCDRLATDRYLRQFERRRASALAACQKGVFERDRGLLPSDVSIVVTNVEPKEAVALVTYKEGGYAGITARLALVRDDAKSRWVLDRVTALPGATRRQMNRALASEIASGPVPFGGRAARCAVRSLAKRGDAQFEEFLLEASPADLFTQVARCDRREFARALVGEVREGGANIRAPRQACLERELARQPAGLLVVTLVSVEETGDFAVPNGCGA